MADETEDQKRKRLYAAVDALIPYTMKTFPNMGNRTPGSIADDVGMIKELEKLSKAAINTLNGIIDSKLEKGELVAKGEHFKMTLQSSTRTALDQTKAKELLAKEGYEESEYMRETDVLTHKYSKV